MVSPFSAARSRLNEVVDRHAGQQVEIRPKKRGDYGVMPDPDRAGFTFTALLTITTELEDLSGEKGKDWRTSLPSQRGTLSVRPEEVPTGFEFEQGDIVVGLDLPGQPAFEICVRDPYRFDRLRFDLNRI
ncbi:MAG: hypothetical protein AB1592_15810 [Pseudomonadota bacterium]